jgi:Na+-transporting methylmalonyl-CoA/oxaloacetate decarboxylase beta subunit
MNMQKKNNACSMNTWLKKLGGVACFTASVFCTFMILWMFLWMGMSHRSTPDLLSPVVLGWLMAFSIPGLGLMTGAVKLFYSKLPFQKLVLRSFLAYMATGPVLIGSYLLLSPVMSPIL